MAARKPKIGRPTTYDPSYCDVVRDMMSTGLSKTAVAGHLKVSRQRLIDWADANPDFRDAIKEGEAMRTLRLEQDLLSAETGPQVTSRIFALKNAAPEEWRDMKAVEMTGKDGGPIKTEEVARDAESFARRISGLAAANAGEGNGVPDGSAEGGA